MTTSSDPPLDVDELLRSREFHKLLVLCGLTGFVVSIVAWGFLSLVPWIQDLVYLELPDALGFGETPDWWPVPVLVVAGVITAVAVTRMKGGGGGIPAEGLPSGITDPANLPGILLAALATLGLGLVLGPSSPVIALGMGVAQLVLNVTRRDAPDQVRTVVAAAGAFAALAMVFSNPIVAAIILIEALGLSGAMAPVVVLPALLAAGIGSVVYFGLGRLSGLDTSAYALGPIQLENLGELTVAEFAWAVPAAAVAGAVGWGVVWVGRSVATLVGRRPMALVPVAGLAVALLAVLFSTTTGETEFAVLFSGSRALGPVVSDAATWSLATLALLLVLKTVAWSISMGSFRGGPVFPAIFVGTTGGLLAANLPGLPASAAVPVVLAATVTAILRLPLAAAVIALLLTSEAGLRSTPLIIVGVVVSYVVVEKLDGWRPVDATD